MSHFHRFSRRFLRLTLIITLLSAFILSSASPNQIVYAATFNAGTEAELTTAINNVNAAGAGPHTINITADIALTGPPTAITNNTTITINGNGHTVSQTAGCPACRVFRIAAPGSTVTFNNITITGGNTGSHGGGIRSRGNVTVTNSAITSNDANGYGGGVFGLGDVTLTNSVISGNRAFFDDGGGIYSASTVAVTNSTVSSNSAGFNGGGVAGVGPVTVTNSTVSGNSAGNHGGGIRSDGNGVTVTDSVISGNTAGNNSGGIAGGVGPVTVTNSTVSGNSAGFRGGGIRAAGIVTVTGSTFADNFAADVGGAIMSFDAGTAVNNNCIFGNTGLNAIYNGSGVNAQDYTNNWWGAADGPSGIGPGSGDSIGTAGGPVNFTPWATAPIIGVCAVAPPEAAAEPLSDLDGDGVADIWDNCMQTPNPDQSDVDGDGRGDVCDNCPTASNPDQSNSDNDQWGDVCDDNTVFGGRNDAFSGTSLGDLAANAILTRVIIPVGALPNGGDVYWRMTVNDSCGLIPDAPDGYLYAHQPDCVGYFDVFGIDQAGYSFGNFNSPVQVCFRPSAIGGTQVVGHYYGNPGLWDILPTTAIHGELCGTTDHLSGFALLVVRDTVGTNSSPGAVERGGGMNSDVAGADENNVGLQSDATCAITTQYRVNLRAAANANADVLAVIPHSTQLTATGITSDDWYAVTYEGMVGYIFSSNASYEDLACRDLGIVE